MKAPRSAALLLGVALLAPADSPRTVIEQTVQDVTAVLHDSSLPGKAKRERIEAVVDARLDIDTLSKLVLARGWSRFSSEQHLEFFYEFKRHLILTYFKNADRAAFERIDVYEDRDEVRGDWTVRTRVISDVEGDVLIDYRLRRIETSEWRVIDIIIEGVSLVSNFRSQFQEILSDHEPVELIDMLRKRNADSTAAYDAVEAAPDESP